MIRILRGVVLLIVAYSLPLSVCSADVPVRICSQNLQRFGDAASQKRQAGKKMQGDALIDRFQEARCDIIAVQEVYGKFRDQAYRNLKRLSTALGVISGREFEIVLGDNVDDLIRNGFLIATDRFTIKEVLHRSQDALPKLSLRGQGMHFTREPIGVVVETLGAHKRQLALISLHFKSRVGGYKDPTGTEFEILRMEMSEATRTWAQEIRSRQPNLSAVLVMGDRNANRDSASASILRGDRTLESFRKGGCKVNKALEAECSTHIGVMSDFLDVYASRVTPRGGNPAEGAGTFRFKGQEEIIDDVLIERSRWNLVAMSGGKPLTGIVGRYREGSDHKLVWVEILP